MNYPHKDTVSQLVKDKMIRRYYKDKIRSLRLTRKGRDTETVWISDLTRRAKLSRTILVG